MRKAQPEPRVHHGGTFEINHFYERVIEFRRTNPRDFDALSPVTKQSLYAYETAKREAQRLQAIRDEPDAA